MAERRMFAKTIVTSDAFLDMPLSARCLYFTLGIFADDDGFVNSPKSIMRQVGASIDDLNLLLVKKFVISFDSGVIVIKHWRINNYLRSDRYKETNYLEEKAQLVIEENGAYTLKSELDTVGIPSGIPSIGKDSIGKVSKEREVSKKESNKKNIETYDEIFADLEVSKPVKGALIDFIRHLSMNGVKMINSRLTALIVWLDMKYDDDNAKIHEIRQAIKNGYKRLPCEGE